MAGLRLKFHVFAVASLALVAGCEEGQEINLFGAGETTPTTLANGEVPTVERDVEMPDVFYRAEAGLWDGRPSLGGIWVAHPDVSSPERVKIVNDTNGREVMGALFRRERNNPGPSFQVSSDAASELGILAGSPTPITVTAVRLQQVPIAPVVEEAAEVETGEITETPLDQDSATASDPIASLAASAIENATAAKPDAKVKPQARPTQEVAAVEPTSAMDKPFIQVGIFSQKENADATSKLLGDGGVVPLVKEFTSNDKKYWRVIVGPMKNSTELQSMLKKIQGLGFADAYPVTN